MQTKFIEATDATEFNHGKFMLCAFTEEDWQIRSSLSRTRLLTSTCGWTPEHLIVFDIQTGEGAMFMPGGLASADLENHRIWVCPMFEPFLEWLYRWCDTHTLADLAALPAMVNLGDVPTSLHGYRRPGPTP